MSPILGPIVGCPTLHYGLPYLATVGFHLAPGSVAAGVAAASEGTTTTIACDPVAAVAAAVVEDIGTGTGRAPNCAGNTKLHQQTAGDSYRVLCCSV